MIFKFVPSLKGRNESFMSALASMNLENDLPVHVSVRLKEKSAHLTITQGDRSERLYSARITNKPQDELIERLATLRVVVGALAELGLDEIETDSPAVNSYSG